MVYVATIRWAMTLADKIVVAYGKSNKWVRRWRYTTIRSTNSSPAIGSPKMNFLPAIVSDWQPERLTVTPRADHQLALNIATQPLKPGAAVTLGIRPGTSPGSRHWYRGGVSM